MVNQWNLKVATDRHSRLVLNRCAMTIPATSQVLPAALTRCSDLLRPLSRDKYFLAKTALDCLEVGAQIDCNNML